jgi:hypothetical protein
MSTASTPAWVAEWRGAVAEPMTPTTGAAVASSRFRAWGALLLAPVLLLVVARQFFALTDPDYWWHVRTGQYIYETGAVPHADFYSFTAAGQPWIAHEWLTEFLFYVVQQHAGYLGNVLLFGLVSAGTILAVYAACRLRGVSEPGSTFLVLVSFAMAMGSVNVRPQTLTMLLLATTALVLTAYRQGRRRLVWLLPPLLALWVNLHGGYLIGLGLIWLTCGGEIITGICRRPTVPLRPLLLASGLSTLVVLVNPNGPDALRYSLAYAAGGDNGWLGYITEWQRPSATDPATMAFVAAVLLAVGLAAARRLPGPVEALWLLVFGALGFQAVRHLALFAVIAPPILGAGLRLWLPPFHRPFATWRHPARLSLTWALVVLGCSLLLLLRMSAAGARAQTGWEPGADGYPAGAVSYLRGHPAAGARVFGDYAWGGYLIYSLYPEHAVFIDGRIDVYGSRIGQRYAAVADAAPGWRQVLDDEGVDVVVAKRGSQLARALADDPAWRESYVGDVEQVFQRAAAEPAAA